MSARNKTNNIIKNHLILCEGIDDKNFLIEYLNSEALKDNPNFSQDIQVIDFGGNSNLTQFLAASKRDDNFRNLKSLLIIRDAETNFQSAMQSIQKSLESNELPVPKSPFIWEAPKDETPEKDETPKTGFLLFPTCDAEPTNGTLEDLCFSILSNVKAPDLKQEIANFMDTLKAKHQFNFTHPFKTQLHTYFSIHNNYVSLKIGEAARAGAFDWNHKKLTPLKEFLLKMFI